MSGYMHIARGNNICSIATYNYYPTVTVTGSTTNAPVTTTTIKPVTATTTSVKPVTTTTIKPVTATTTSVKPVTTTTTKPVNTTCTNGSGYYLVPNSGCQKYYYCSDSIGTNNLSYICASGYIIDQVNQYCIPNTSNYVTSSGNCINGSSWYNYPGCTIYYCCILYQ